MTDRSLFGSFPHLACIGFGVVLMAFAVTSGELPVAALAGYFLAGVGFAALGLIGQISSGSSLDVPVWAKLATASSWVVGVLFVLLVIALTWFVIALLRAFAGMWST